MEIKTNLDGACLTIAISGDFNFKARTQFNNAFKGTPKGTAYVVDFSRVDTIDSSGIGMLLLLREHAGVTDADISLVNCRPVVKEALLLARFDQLFKLQ